MANLSWLKFIEYARTQGVIVEERGNRKPKYEMFHEQDDSVIHNVDTLDEAVESLHELTGKT